MNQKTKFCERLNHYEFQITHYCTFEGCDLLQRLCCIQCIDERIHKHGKAVIKHIKQLQEIQSIYKQEPQQFEIEKITMPHKFDSNRQYILKQIDYKSSLKVQISNDEKQIAFDRDSQILIIYQIQDQKIIKEINCYNEIFALSFTFDSQKLYVGQEDYKILCFDVKRNFKKIFQCTLNEIYIGDIRTIQINIWSLKIVMIQQQNLILKARKEYSNYILKRTFTHSIIISNLVFLFMDLVMILQKYGMFVKKVSSQVIHMTIIIEFGKYNSWIIQTMYQVQTVSIIYINGRWIIINVALSKYKNLYLQNIQFFFNQLKLKLIINM